MEAIWPRMGSILFWLPVYSSSVKHTKENLVRYLALGCLTLKSWEWLMEYWILLQKLEAEPPEVPSCRGWRWSGGHTGEARFQDTPRIAEPLTESCTKLTSPPECWKSRPLWGGHSLASPRVWSRPHWTLHRHLGCFLVCVISYCALVCWSGKPRKHTTSGV